VIHIKIESTPLSALAAGILPINEAKLARSQAGSV